MKKALAFLDPAPPPLLSNAAPFITATSKPSLNGDAYWLTVSIWSAEKASQGFSTSVFIASS